MVREFYIVDREFPGQSVAPPQPKPSQSTVPQPKPTQEKPSEEKQKTGSEASG
ncbi:hypothetical protein [Vulcanisaeta souniana]|uniref:hypothetical protein n=1 Tax=Vulcanisaeta souniana TaxID=164452 RepID=UPI001FB20564|nr:hypothetical protein [Vulcanisaeta souniana]